jgi:hypothetical protein
VLYLSINIQPEIVQVKKLLNFFPVNEYILWLEIIAPGVNVIKLFLSLLLTNGQFKLERLSLATLSSLV